VRDLSQSGPQRQLQLFLVQPVLSNGGPGPRRLLRTQSVSGHAIRDRLHLVRSDALELRRGSPAGAPGPPREAQVKKTLVAVAILAMVIVPPALAKAKRAQSARPQQGYQSSERPGYYHGYPLSDWYRDSLSSY